MQQQFFVSGMACVRCAAAVQDVLSALPDVTSVQADCETGRVILTADKEIPARLVRIAVEEAGYALLE